MKNAKDEENGSPPRITLVPANGETSFDRFTEFARKVVAVPKPEMDEQERRYRRSRAAKRRRRS